MRQLLLILMLLLLMACDTQLEEPANEILVSIYPFDLETQIGSLSMSNELALPLDQFPKRQYRVSMDGWQQSWEPINLPAEFEHSLYMLITAPALGFVQLAPFSTTAFDLPTKTASADSMDVSLHFFLVEKPDLVYPDAIKLTYGIDGNADVVTIHPAKHIVPLENQINTAGSALGQLPPFMGLKVEVRAAQIDTTMIPVSLFSNIEHTPSPGAISRESFHLAGKCFASILQEPCHEWASAYYRMAEDSGVRLFMLTTD